MEKKDEATMSKRVYHGEHCCEGKSHGGKLCPNMAYWKLSSKYLCGVHSKRNSMLRRPLPKRSKKELEEKRRFEEAAHSETVEIARKENAANGRHGAVTLQKMRMMHTPVVKPGVLNVYPNFKDQNRSFGFGCRSLSPKAMGPVVHGQPQLPNALNIENLHQGSKCFAEELDDDGDPGVLYYVNRLRFYQDPEPHRHKYKGRDGNPNIPKFFVWVDKQKAEHRLTYIQSRQFYCNFYERLAVVQPDYVHICDMIRNGTNVEICGYDGNPLGENETIEQAYLDGSVPFGHERVLYTMLLYESRGTPKNEYPLSLIHI